jgi:high-affinity iron transporter
MNEFLITFRESLEAALIVGIIFAVLDKNNLHHLKKSLWVSVITAVVASAVLGVVLYSVLENAPEGTRELLEGVFMYITAALLFYVIFWMSKTLASRDAITSQTKDAAANKGNWGIFLLVFFAIVREGFETALFLVASASIDESFSYVGFFVGILLAVLIGYLIVIQGKKIQLRAYFKYTSLLLVFFAAGMVAYGTHEVHEYIEEREHEEAEALAEQAAANGTPLPAAHAEEEEVVYDIFKAKSAEDQPSSVWYNQVGDDYIHILNDKGSIGVFFKGLFGYNSNPILIEVILWFVSLIFGLIVWRRAYK